MIWQISLLFFNLWNNIKISKIR